MELLHRHIASQDDLPPPRRWLGFRKRMGRIARGSLMAEGEGNSKGHTVTEPATITASSDSGESDKLKPFIEAFERGYQYGKQRVREQREAALIGPYPAPLDVGGPAYGDVTIFRSDKSSLLPPPEFELSPAEVPAKR